jgi:hypothetical protein
VNVDVAEERRVDAAMKPGQVSTKVEVTGDQLPLVETTTNTLGGVLTAETVENMPVNGRDYTKLIYLNPGVAGSPDQISARPKQPLQPGQKGLRAAREPRMGRQRKRQDGAPHRLRHVL